MIKISLLLAALGTFPGVAAAQFIDTFDTLNPAWITNRYAPAGFAPTMFDGDNRLQLTIDETGSTANRDFTFDGLFYNTQGKQRASGITGLWTLSAEVYVSSAFATTTGPLVSAELWAHTGTTPAGGDYMTIGFTNASPTDPLNPAAADREFRFRVFNTQTANWIDLGVPVGFVFDTWHTLSGTSTGNTFEYRIDNDLAYTQATTAGEDLLDAMIQGYNFSEAGSYSVYWDNVTASAIPEPATTVLCVGLAMLGIVCFCRRRTAK